MIFICICRMHDGKKRRRDGGGPIHVHADIMYLYARLHLQIDIDTYQHVTYLLKIILSLRYFSIIFFQFFFTLSEAIACPYPGKSTKVMVGGLLPI